VKTEMATDAERRNDSCLHLYTKTEYLICAAFQVYIVCCEIHFHS